MRASRILLLAVAAALWACESPTVPAEEPKFDATQLTGGLVYHWPVGRTIAIWVDTTAQPAGFDLEAAARAGAAAWERQAYYKEFSFRFTRDPHDADVVVRYRATPRPVDDASCDPAGGGAGETIFCPDVDAGVMDVMPLLAGGGGHIEADVLIEPYWVSDAFLASHQLTRQEHFGRLVTHELGHVLGIGGHSPDESDLMGGLAIAPRISAGDASTLRWVLRQPVDLRM